MNNIHARSTHTQGSKSFFKILLFIAIICAVVFSIAFSGAYQGVAYAAARDVVDGTMLATTTGLALGNNIIRTTSSNATAEYLSGDSTSDNRYGNDFYFDLTISDWDSSTSSNGNPNRVGYTDEGMYLNYYTDATSVMQNATSFSFMSKVLLQDDNLAAALRGTGRVDATISLEYQFYRKDQLTAETVVDNPAYTDTFDFECAWAPNGVVNESTVQENKVITGDKQIAKMTLTLDKSGFDYSKAFLSIKLGNFQTDGADKTTDGTQTRYSTGIFVRFSNITVSIINAEDYTLHYESTGVRVAETGTLKTRDDANTIYTQNNTVYFESKEVTADSTDYTLSNQDIYVKMGDMIYLYSDVFMTPKDSSTSERMPLSPTYAQSVNSDGKAIQWIYTEDAYFYGYNHYISLQDYSNTEDQASGRTTIYRVNYSQSGENSETMIEMKPRMISSFYEDPENPGVYLHREVQVLSTNYAKVYFDNVRPVTPEISESSTLGRYGYSTAVYGDIEEQSIEKRYTDGLIVDFTLQNYDQLNLATGTAKAPESIYYTINGDSPQDATATRYRAELDSNGTASIDLSKATPDGKGGIGNGSGFYEIRLVAVDAAGNYSDVVTYKIVVDNEPYQVNIAYKAGLSTKAQNKTIDARYSGIATISMTNASGAMTSGYSRSYKRGSDVAIRVEMTAAQMNNYELVAINNKGSGTSFLSWTKDEIHLEYDSSLSKYVYTINVKLDKYMNPTRDEEGHILGFSVRSDTLSFYVYDRIVYMDGADGIVDESSAIGSYDPESGVITLNKGIYQSTPILYKVVLEGDEKGLYLLAQNPSGSFTYDGDKYLTVLENGVLISIDSTTVNLIGVDAEVRTFYFTFKQRVKVSVNNPVTTFKFTNATASINATADIQEIGLNPQEAYSLVEEGTEKFAGLKDQFDVKYYRLVSATYRSIAELQAAGFDLETALSSGHLELYVENGVAHAPRYAGEYWYTATISTVSSFYSDYYYNSEGTFIIEKASPGTLDVQFGEVKDGAIVSKSLIYANGGMQSMDEYILGIDNNNEPSKNITSIGVMGSYRISTDTPDYLNPNAGEYYVKVIFTPDKINTNEKFAILNSDNIATTDFQIRLVVEKANVAIKVEESSLTKPYNRGSQVVDVTVKLHDDLPYMPVSSIPNATGATITVSSNLRIDTSDMQIEYYFRTDTSAAFSRSIPVNAGIYDVKIVVSGLNYYGEIVFSDDNRYFSSADSVIGTMYGEDYTLYGETIDVHSDNSSVQKRLNGLVLDGTRYFIAGDKLVSYTGTKENVAITLANGIYDVTLDGGLLKYVLYNNAFYSIDLTTAVKSVESYENNYTFYYRTLYTLNGTKYYYDSTGVYSDRELTTKIGDVDFNVLNIEGNLYYIGADNELYLMTLASDLTAVTDYSEGDFTINGTHYYIDTTAEKVYTVAADDQRLEITPTLIYNYNGDFHYDGQFYTVKQNNIFKRMEFCIEKKELSIETGFLDSYEYTYYELPIANSQMRAYELVEVEGEQRKSYVLVEFSIKYYYSATEGGTYEELEKTDVTKFDAGYYQAYIVIVANNYKGASTDTFIINKVGRSLLTVNAPEAVPQDSAGGHIAYGQMLQDVVLSTGNNVNVKYQSKNGSMTVGLSGNYRPALRQNAIDPTMDDYTFYDIEVYGEKTYSDTIFETIGLREYNIIFVPDDLVNFKAFVVSVFINVTVATPLYAGDTSEDSYNAKFVKKDTGERFLIYGDKFSDVVLNVSSEDISAKGEGYLFFYKGTEKQTIKGQFTTATAASTVFSAGEHIITYSFVPNDEERFRAISFDLVLVVERKQLTVNYIASEYTVPYGGTIDIIKDISNQENADVAGYQYKIYRDASMTEEMTYTTRLAVGNYYINVAVDDDNYSGALLLPFEIEKALPNIIASPIADNFEWNMQLKDLDVNNGSAIISNSLSQEIISGTFSVSYVDSLYDEMTTFEDEFKAGGNPTYSYNIKLLFTPDEDYSANYEVLTFDWTLNVQRVTLKATDFIFENTTKSYTASPLYPNVFVNIDGQKVDYSAGVQFNQDPIIAGSYSLTLRVNEDNLLYRGSVATSFIIAKRSASDIDIIPNAEYVVDGESLPITSWSGLEVPVEGIYSLSSKDIAQGAPITHTVMVSRGTTDNVDIKNIGRYTIKLTLDGNFEGELSFDFIVKYKEVTYSDAVDGYITRTYTADSIQTGRVVISSIEPSTLAYKIQYAPVDGLVVGSYKDEIPYQAGTYHARLHFEGQSNNGYDGYDEGVTIVINPATSTITAKKLTDFVYTGKGLDAAQYINKCFEVTSSHASITAYNYQYSDDGGLTWVSTPMTDAGDYKLKITPQNSNFTGEAIYDYTIAKANLTLLGGSSAVTTLSIAYSSFVAGENDNAYFTAASLSAFTFAGEIIEGYYIIKDRDTLNTLYRGAYQNYEYTFYPTGEKSSNFHPYVGNTTITIDKLDISSYLTFEESSLLQEYKGKELAAQVRFKKSSELGDLQSLHLSQVVQKSIIDSITIRYGLSQTPPINAGTYDLSTASNHENYSVSIAGVMEIIKAVPQIVLPDYFELVSENVADEANITALNNLKTLYALNGDIAIDGKFTMVEKEAYIAEITFTPTSQTNVMSATSNLRIVYYDSIDYVTSDDIIVAADVTQYGTLLSGVELSLKDKDGNAKDFSEIGSFRWLNGDSIVPDFGANRYTLIFEPHLTNIEHYNIQRFENITVNVGNKKTLTLAELGSIYWDVRLDENFLEGMAVVLDSQYKDLVGFSLDSIISSSGTITGDTIVTADMFKAGSISAKLTFSSANYVIEEEIIAQLNLYLTEDAFDITSGTTAEWTGVSLNKTALYGNSNSIIKLTVTDAGVLPKCDLTIFDMDGTELEEITKIGEYRIKIEIDRSASRYAGSTEIIFTVTPEDLSQYILLNGEANAPEDGFYKEFGDSLSLIPSLDMEAIGKLIDEDDYELLRYYKKLGENGAADTSYSLYNTPFAAGRYMVKVVIANSDYYSGEKQFEYVIGRKPVSISMGGQDLAGGGHSLNVSYGNVSIPTLALGEGVKKYTIVYRSGAITYTTTPENAGEYIATVTVDDTNYCGTATFTLVIAKKQPSITIYPTLLSIPYGTFARNAVMSAWEVSDGDEILEGSMEFVDGNAILNAGTHEDVMLRFVPKNQNYATREFPVELVVTPATSKLLSFNTTELVYTGSEIAIGYNMLLSFVSDADIRFSYYVLNGNALVPATPIEAGTYYVRYVVGSIDGNYYDTNVAEGQLDNQSLYQKIIVKKATALDFVEGEIPYASSVEYGYTLEGYSTITGNSALYDDGNNGSVKIYGTYTFEDGVKPEFEVGTKLVTIVFTPNNSNYEVYKREIPVEIVKAKVVISVTGGTTITYGEKITGIDEKAAAQQFTFSIALHNKDLTESLVLDSEIFDLYVNKVLSSGSYNFKVKLEHATYTGELVFPVTVQKKAIEVAFFSDEALSDAIDMATGYSFTYLISSDVHVGVVTDLTALAKTLVEDPTEAAAVAEKVEEIRNEINSKLVFTFIEESTSKTYTNIANVLKNVGRYRVNVEVLTSLNFSATAWTYVTVGKASIGRIELDHTTMYEQVYGSVAEPIIYIYNADPDNPVKLTNIKYYINWGDSPTMPLSAGVHRATVVIDDPNYVYTERNIDFTINKKALTLINIAVEDKVYDGTPWLNITAEISGAIVGDELGLTITAHTADKSTSVGRHNVTINKCVLTGLHKDNYYIVEPVYNSAIDIYSNAIYTEDQESYVLFAGNIDGKYTFNVQEIESSYNKTGFISTILGQSAQVVAFSIREDGLKVELSAPVQIYIKIPEKYKDRVDLAYSFVGEGVDNDDIVINREGDYISFYTTVSGEIVFETSAFPYGIILIATGVVLLIGGILLIIFLDPAKKKVGFSGLRRKTPVDEAYKKLNEQKHIRNTIPQPLPPDNAKNNNKK